MIVALEWLLQGACDRASGSRVRNYRKVELCPSHVYRGVRVWFRGLSRRVNRKARQSVGRLWFQPVRTCSPRKNVDVLAGMEQSCFFMSLLNFVELTVARASEGMTVTDM